MCIITWVDCLKSVAQNNSSFPHPWICEVKRPTSRNKLGRDSIEVISNIDYQNYLTNQSSDGTSIRRLTLNEIVFKTEEIVKHALGDIPNNFDLSFSKTNWACLNYTSFDRNSTGPTYSENINNALNNSRVPQATLLYPTLEILNKMIAKAESKKEPLPEELWRRIVYYFRSILPNFRLYVLKSAMKEISKIIPDHRVDLDHQIKACKRFVRQEIITLLKEMNVDHTSDKDKLYNAEAPDIKSIKEFWLPNYINAIVPNTEASIRTQKKTLQLTVVWERFIELRINYVDLQNSN